MGVIQEVSENLTFRYRNREYQLQGQGRGKRQPGATRMKRVFPAPTSAADLVHVQHHMVMVAHHRVGGDVDGEDFLQQLQPPRQSGFAVIEVVVGAPVVAVGVLWM